MLRKDIGRDKNQDRLHISLSKANKYPSLNAPLKPDNSFLDSYGVKKVNDEMDAFQLYQAKEGLVDFFVTNDNGIAKKAKSFNIGNKVLSIEKATEILSSTFSKYIPQHPVLNHGSVRAFYNDLNDVFFDSLKADYKGYDNWFKKCVKEDRDCYSLRLNDRLAALLIYNIETAHSHEIESIKGNAIKICTLKVDDDFLGNKLGELFIQKMIELAIEQSIEAVYVTAYEKQNALIKQFERFGFRKEEFQNKQGEKELRLTKYLKEKWNAKNSAKQHPFYKDGDDVQKFIVPIQPYFYSTLFKDGGLRMGSLFDQSEDSLTEIQGNTIVKVYVGGFTRKDIEPGDLLLFYASKTRKAIEPIGIVDSYKQISDFDELWSFVQKRTVFKKAYLQSLLKEKKTVSAIKFRLSHYLSKPIPFKVLKDLESCKNKLQTVTRLRSDDYNLLKDKKYFDERFIID
ncbi:MAG: GNAT family N-acetyltransferase [Bacteroidetes bacterium]|nr:GNAT family N-acetyltransferase [Bacteroidota bacterium]